MNKSRGFLAVVLFIISGVSLPVSAQAVRAASTEEKQLPAALKDWTDWATWDVLPDSVPSLYSHAEAKIKTWPSTLKIQADKSGGSFSLGVMVYHETWFSLPGDAQNWPQQVQVNGQATPVLCHEGDRPCVKLRPGRAEITGRYLWQEMPMSLRVPPEIGVLTLTLEGQAVESPSWDAAGQLWLQRTESEVEDKNFISAQVYRVLEDGLPQWLRTEVELTVSGKSREEELGTVLPEGWQLAAVDAPIPCAVDDQGRLKAQVRAGRWTVALTAYRTSPVEKIAYSAGAKPLGPEELIALQNQPGFRLIELRGVTAIDASQTTFPQKWRQLPIYQWSVEQPIEVVEKMRGMGQQKPPGLTIQREFWLDEDGAQMTYRDQLSGTGQQTWRLDAAPAHQLGSVKNGAQGQLITYNPTAPGAEKIVGVEVRDRALALQAVGRLSEPRQFAATGWRTDAEQLAGKLHLPPGWRVLAVWGADQSYGDWLTKWTLLDVFLVLVIGMALIRLIGWKTGLVAVMALVLSLHEPGAPRWWWFSVAVMLALVTVWPSRLSQAWVRGTYFVIITMFALSVAPFVLRQLQQAIYPQLEAARERSDYRADELWHLPTLSSPEPMLESTASPAPPPVLSHEAEQYSVRSEMPEGNVDDYAAARRQKKIMLKGDDDFKRKQNLAYDQKARIQTGPGVPDWTWRQVSFRWRGPVAEGETVRFTLIPVWLNRLIQLTRVLLFAWVLWALFRWRPQSGKNSPPAEASAPAPEDPVGPPPLPVAMALMIFFTLLLLPAASAQSYPSEDMLKLLRERVLQPQQPLAQEAVIPQAQIKLVGRQLTMEAEIHTARLCAVPLPGALPSWSPLSVRVADVPEAPFARHHDYLWVVLPPGVHRVTVTGLLPPSGEWVCSFSLRPARLSVEAPGWAVTGLSPNGVPEAQVFFAEENRSTTAEAAYDRKDYRSLVIVERELDLGLVWTVRTTVRRLTPGGTTAISLSLPLLAGERILSPSTATVTGGRVDCRLGPQEDIFQWESELDIQPNLTLTAEKTDRWVEQWRLQTSPVWNVALSGLAPVYEAHNQNLSPTWHPWPGESATLTLARPEAVSGETTTIRRVHQKTDLGHRQRTTTLTLDVQASLGTDFPITLDPTAEITSLRLAGQEIPVRRDGAQLLIPLVPGEQTIEVKWKTPRALTTRTQFDPVQLPVESANITQTTSVPSDRWILWAHGPLRGPAVRFWSLLAGALLIGFALGRLPFSPLRAWEWMILITGLTQVHYAIAIAVIAWFFIIAARGKNYGGILSRMPRPLFKLSQLMLVFSLLPFTVMLLSIVHTGLLGQPAMAIAGPQCHGAFLTWFQARSQGLDLPQPGLITVSIWVYRGLMLLWALWLAWSFIRWIRWAWTQVTTGGFWDHSAHASDTPPPSSSAL